VTDTLKLAQCLISSGMDGTNARIVHTLHDEIIVEAREDIEDQMKAIVEESMEETFKRIIPEVPFVVEPGVADSWG
jgi:DNA polymerase I